MFRLNTDKDLFARRYRVSWILRFGVMDCPPGQVLHLYERSE